jgi:hypothetical protein
VFVDPDLLQYDEVLSAAGAWNDNFGAAPVDIVRVAGGVVTDTMISQSGCCFLKTESGVHATMLVFL